jgi:single-stranded DNA-binding protein
MSFYGAGVIRILTVPERRAFESGAYITTFYGGLSEGKDKDGNYIENAIDVKIWGKQGDIISGERPLLGKGDSFVGSGKVVQEKWPDKETGQVRSKHVLEIGRIELLPRAASDQGQTTAQPAAPAPSPFGDGPDDDEIPF